MENKASLISNRYVVRRIRRDQVDRRIRESESKPKGYYPNHDEWLEQALPEVKAGKRVAFGVFLNSELKQREYEVYVGSIILKGNHISNFAEIKNINTIDDKIKTILGEDNFNQYILEIKWSLINKAIFHAERKGYEKIRIELPNIRRNEITYLINKEFETDHTSQNYYIDGIRVYFLERETKTYWGDYFDFYKTVHWFLSNTFSLNIRDSQFDTTLDSTDYYKEYRILTKLNEKNPFVDVHEDRAIAQAHTNTINKFRYISRILVSDTSDRIKDIIHIIESKHDLHSVFMLDHSREIEDACSARNVRYFTFEEIDKLLNRNQYSKKPFFRKEDIAGYLAVCSEHFFNRMEPEIVSVNKTEFAFYVLNDTAKYLDNHKIFSKKIFFCVPQKDYNQGTICAIADVIDVDFNTPKKIWEKFKLRNFNYLMSKEEYEYYTGFSQTHKVTGLVCRNLEIIQKPINFFSCLEKSHKDQHIDFYKSKFRVSGINPAYITASIRDSIMNEFNKQTLSQNIETPKNKVFVSYLREDYEKVLPIVEKLKNNRIDVWFDKDKVNPGENWRTKVQNAIENCEFYIICLSGLAISTRGYFYTELKAAYKEQAQRGNEDVYIIPILLEDLSPKLIPAELRRLDFARIYENFETEMQKIVTTIETYARRQ